VTWRPAPIAGQAGARRGRACAHAAHRERASTAGRAVSGRRGADGASDPSESYQQINNFYTATVYQKGSEVVRMQQTLLGREGFPCRHR